MVSAWVGRVNFSFSVEWLMDVTNVVNHQAKSERQLICWVGESSSDLLVVGGACVVSSVGQHASESFKCGNKVGGSCLESVIRRGSALVVVGNVNKMPV